MPKTPLPPFEKIKKLGGDLCAALCGVFLLYLPLDNSQTTYVGGLTTLGGRKVCLSVKNKFIQRGGQTKTKTRQKGTKTIMLGLFQRLFPANNPKTPLSFQWIG